MRNLLEPLITRLVARRTAPEQGSALKDNEREQKNILNLVVQATLDDQLYSQIYHEETGRTL